MKNSRFDRSVTAKWPGVVFVAIIFTVLFVWIFDWVVEAAKTSSDEKSHNEVGYLASAQPVPETYAAIIRDVFNGRSRKFKDLNMYPFRSGLANPRLFDYHGTTNNFVLSYDNGPTLQEISAQSENDLVPRNFLSERGLSEPKSLTTNRGENAEFHFGDVFLGFEKGTIVLLSGDQTEITTFSLRLEVSDVDGGLAIDDTGAFGHELIAVVSRGRIWRVEASGNSSLVTDLNTAVNGLAIIPDDLEHFGPIAGTIIVGAPRQKGIYSIDRTGRASFYPLDVEPSDIVRINPNENLFAISGKSGILWGIDSANSKIGYGDIVVATKEPGKIFLLRWGGTQFELSGLTIDESVDQIISAPIAVRPDSAPCVASISPNQNTFQWQGGSGSYAVVAPANCSWTSSSDSPWVQITSGQNGTGNGTVSYVVGKNSFSVLRQANLSVDSLVHKVLQSRKALSQCYLTTSSANPTIAAAGGSGALNIAVNSECAWSAVSDSPWLTLNENSGFGNGTISYTAVPNFTAQSRKAIISFPGIPSEPATVTQLPNQAPGVKAGRPQTISIPNTAFLEGRAADDGVGNPVTTSWSKVSGPESVIFSEAGNPISTAIFSKEGIYVLRLTATDGYLTSSDKIQITVLPDPVPPPPDPITIAPPLNGTVTTNIATATKFLYTGPNAIQTGVNPANIKPERVSLVHGRVIGRNNAPISNVMISVLDHPEFGQTKSRADGKFDLVVNGGGDLTLKYEKQGFITSQREEKIDWQTYEMSDDVVMIAYDGSVAAIDLSAAIPVQVATGSVSSDSSGQRRPQLLFKQGTTAVATLPNGSIQPLIQLHVRSTEFTVGANGRAAMPGDLPPTSEYTYATEYSVDEAVAVNAVKTEFSQPVIQYLENFVDFPTGVVVPTGSYNKMTGDWEPEENGKVVKILSTSGGVANLDLAGNGTPATDQEYAALGINVAERQKLAEIYQANQTLWRVPLRHFSAWDCNYPFASKPPPDAPPPFFAKPKTICEEEDGCEEEVESQTVTETIEILQTRYQIILHKDPIATGAVIPLVGPTPQKDVVEAAAIVNIAGRTIKSDIFPVSPNLTYNFEWNGLDDYGRRTQGRQKATVSVVNFYPMAYALPGQPGSPQFGQTGNGTGQTVSGTGKSIAIRNYEFELGGSDRSVTELGGWAFGIHHIYNPVTRTLIGGDGSQRSASTIMQSISTTAGSTDQGFAGDGGPATAARFNTPSDVAFAADGSYYIADSVNNRIRRVAGDGIVTTFAGNGVECVPTTSCGDGGAAVNAQLSAPQGVAVGPDGSVYVSDTDANRIRKIASNGIISTIVGTGTQCQPMAGCGDNGPGTAATLNAPNKIHLATDGSLFIADKGSNRVKKLSTDGTITTVAGNGMANCQSDNIPALTACVESPTGVALTSNGSLYITANAPSHSQVVRLDTDGSTHKIADGICNGARPEPEGLRSICNPMGVVIGSDDNAYVASAGENRIYKYDTDGIWKDIVGSGSSGIDDEGQPVLNASLRQPSSSAFAPNGDLFVAVAGDNRIRRAASPLPGFTNSDTLIASEDGTEVFQFDGEGRHLRTLNALTGTNKYVFGYNAAGNLTSITDGDNNVTTVERDGAGKPTGIRSPYGQLTTLTLDPNGYLASVTNPAGESNRYTYSADGFLLTKRDPNNNLNTFAYDGNGRLIKNENSAGGSHVFSKTGNASDYTVTHKSPLNRISTFRVQNAPNGDETQDITFEDASQYQVSTLTDGSASEVDTDGTTSQATLGPDPRWAMQGPLAAATRVATPAGRISNLTLSRATILSDQANPLSLTEQHDIYGLNDRNYRVDYTQANKTFSISSPMNRPLSFVIDGQERVTRFERAGLDPVLISYDARGRLGSLTFGSGTNARNYSNTYNLAGYLASQINPLNRANAFQYDLAGRITQKTLADNRSIGFGYDAYGNLTSITPPGRPTHTLSYNSRNLRSSYTAPNLGGNSTTTYEYNADGDLTRLLRPDTLQINYAFNALGQIATKTTPSGSYGYAYNAQSGNLTSITAPGGVTNGFDYDGFLVTNASVAGPISGGVSYTYNNDFLLSSISVNGAAHVDYIYDNDSLLIGAGGMTMTRNAQNNLLTRSTLGNITNTINYNGFGEPAVYNSKFNTTSLYNVEYSYDKLGRIVRKVELIGGSTTTYDYAYDTTNRLAAVTLNDGPQPIVTYGYDSNDNRTSISLGGNVTNATYDAQDRMTTYGLSMYTYTPGGELLTKTGPGGTTIHNYDVSGNLRSVTLPGGTQIEYVIDGFDRRIGKKVNGTLVQGFLYQDELKIIAELNAAGGIVSRFVYASRSNVPDFMIKNGLVYQLICDQVGSVRLVVDVSTGNIAQRIDYDEFGVVFQDSNPGFQPFGFAGGLYDSQTKLLRFGARDYDAETGRWTAKDPLYFGGGYSNLYVYCGMDPINSIDPSGKGGPDLFTRLINGPGDPAYVAQLKLIELQEAYERDLVRQIEELKRRLKCEKNYWIKVLLHIDIIIKQNQILEINQKLNESRRNANDWAQKKGIATPYENPNQTIQDVIKQANQESKK